jgi:1-acyl-sn-glycerol-3-phosphate acyltransferase
MMSQSPKETIMTLLRVQARAPLAMGWTFFSHWHVRSRQIFGPKNLRERRSMDIVSRWGKGLAQIMGVRIVERNQRSGPMGDVIIANHMGFLDIPVLLTYYPAVFLIKMEIRRIPYFGRALERGGHVFVDRKSSDSRRSARDGVRAVLADGDRVIIFPEGRGSSGAERRPFKPFCFFEAARQGKMVEACVIDYLPDREAVRWDINRKMLPQLIEIIGRRETEVSVEFFPAEVPDDPVEAAQRYHDLIQGRLEAYDREREESAAATRPTHAPAEEEPTGPRYAEATQ